MSNLITEAKAALESAADSAKLEAVHARVKNRIAEAVARHDGITGDTRLGSVQPPQPTARQKCIDAGDLAEIRKLDDEAQALKSEVEILRSLQGKLRKRWDETLAQEYVDATPGSYQEIGELLTAEAEAEAALRKARQATDGAMQHLRDARHHVQRQSLQGSRLEVPAAPAELLRVYMQTRHYRYVRDSTRTGWFAPGANFHDLANVAAALGVEKPGPQSEAVAA